MKLFISKGMEKVNSNAWDGNFQIFQFTSNKCINCQYQIHIIMGKYLTQFCSREIISKCCQQYRWTVSYSLIHFRYWLEQLSFSSSSKFSHLWKLESCSNVPRCVRYSWDNTRSNQIKQLKLEGLTVGGAENWVWNKLFHWNDSSPGKFCLLEDSTYQLSSQYAFGISFIWQIVIVLSSFQH